jgi:hypothetical protein
MVKRENITEDKSTLKILAQGKNSSNVRMAKVPVSTPGPHRTSARIEQIFMK